jgi:hypothetical protein
MRRCNIPAAIWALPAIAGTANEHENAYERVSRSDAPITITISPEARVSVTLDEHGHPI